MQLAEIVTLRPRPAAGLLVTLTRRCPLSCAHCSTSSGPRGEDTPAGALRRFVGGFTPGDRPELLMLTGGEPLLRPGLVAGLAASARRAGTRTAVLSGMFFAAEDGRVPGRILRAVAAVDHFSASVDAFHEHEVPRRSVFRALHRIMDAGVVVSLHVVGRGPLDPYLAEVTAAVRAEFRDRVPMLVNEIRPVGRAAGWADWAGSAATAPSGGPADARPAPCTMAAWPVVAFDGTVLACCNQRAVDLRPAPAHLRLGHIEHDDWSAVRRRCLDSPVLRTLRTAGPPPGPGGACARCRALDGDPGRLAEAHHGGSGPAAPLLDVLSARAQQAAGPVALLRRYGSARYAPLVLLGCHEPPGAGTP